MKKLYSNIKALRKANGWSQEDLAKRMGYTDRSMIAKIESGLVDLAESKIMAFAKVFNVKPTVLMGFDESSEELDLLSHDPEEIKRALSFLDAYSSLSPDVQTAIQLLLKSHQSDS